MHQIREEFFNLGFLLNCNNGVNHASGRLLCFLNNDTTTTDGWLDALKETLDREPMAGAVGSKLIYPNVFSRSRWDNLEKWRRTTESTMMAALEYNYHAKRTTSVVRV